jgi:hypothetical protein
MVGVGHFFMNSDGVGTLFMPCDFLLRTLVDAVGVPIQTDDPNSVPLMWRADLCCSQHSPLRIKPQRGQVSKNSSKPPRSEHWGVFHEHESGSNFTNDPRHFSPHS